MDRLTQRCDTQPESIVWYMLYLAYYRSTKESTKLLYHICKGLRLLGQCCQEVVLASLNYLFFLPKLMELETELMMELMNSSKDPR